MQDPNCAYFFFEPTPRDNLHRRMADWLYDRQQKVEVLRTELAMVSLMTSEVPTFTPSITKKAQRVGQKESFRTRLATDSQNRAMKSALQQMIQQADNEAKAATLFKPQLCRRRKKTFLSSPIVIPHEFSH